MRNRVKGAKKRKNINCADPMEYFVSIGFSATYRQVARLSAYAKSHGVSNSSVLCDLIDAHLPEASEETELRRRNESRSDAE